MSAKTTPPDRDMLHAYVDGQLTAGEEQTVRIFLANHGDVAAEVADWQAQNEAMRALFPAPDHELALPLTATTSRAPWRAVAAALAMLGVGLAAGWFARGTLGQNDTRIVASLVQEAVAAHVVYASDQRRPVEIPAAQESQLVKWLSKRLGYALTVPDLSSKGFELVGGRLVPAQEGPAAQFMYQDKAGHRITLFAVRAQGSQMASFSYRSEGDAGSFYWQDENLSYALVGDVPRARLLALATAVYQQLS